MAKFGVRAVDVHSYKRKVKGKKTKVKVKAYSRTKGN